MCSSICENGLAVVNAGFGSKRVLLETVVPAVKNRPLWWLWFLFTVSVSRSGALYLLVTLFISVCWQYDKFGRCRKWQAMIVGSKRCCWQ